MKLPLLRRPELCATCHQPIVPPASSVVAGLRLVMAAGAFVAGAVEYRRAVKRERDSVDLEQLHQTGVDAPLDAHLDRARRDNPDARDRAGSAVDQGGDGSAHGPHPYSMNPDPNPEADTGDDDAPPA